MSPSGCRTEDHAKRISLCSFTLNKIITAYFMVKRLITIMRFSLWRGCRSTGKRKHEQKLVFQMESEFVCFTVCLLGGLLRYRVQSLHYYGCMVEWSSVMTTKTLQRCGRNSTAVSPWTSPKQKQKTDLTWHLRSETPVSVYLGDGKTDWQQFEFSRFQLLLKLIRLVNSDAGRWFLLPSEGYTCGSPVETLVCHVT